MGQFINVYSALWVVFTHPLICFVVFSSLSFLTVFRRSLNEMRYINKYASPFLLVPYLVLLVDRTVKASASH